MINYQDFQFHPVIHLPKNYQIMDFSVPQKNQTNSAYSIGRYNEKRVGVYDQPLFNNNRDIHVGLDIGAPAGTEVFAFFEGEILFSEDNQTPGDYGPTLVTKHLLGGIELFALWGHLSRGTLKTGLITGLPGTKFKAGEKIAQIGTCDENGGWPTHLHFQLSYERPHRADLPGVVSEKDLTQALLMYPDPRLVLGPLY